MRYDTLLFDADDTVFDFQSSAEKCFLATCKEFGFADEQSDYSVYKVINQKFWDDYSAGKIKKSDIILKRFEVYAERYGITLDTEKFAKSYENKLAHTCILLPNAETALKELKAAGARLYMITNGVTFVQNTRLDLSGLRPLFSGVFISDEIGYAKPSKEYFSFVEKAVSDFDKKKTLIIGDSVVSDVALGVNNGVDVCLMNFHGENADENVGYKYEIKELTEIKEIIK